MRTALKTRWAQRGERETETGRNIVPEGEIWMKDDSMYL